MHGKVAGLNPILRCSSLSLSKRDKLREEDCTATGELFQRCASRSTERNSKPTTFCTMATDLLLVGCGNGEPSWNVHSTRPSSARTKPPTILFLFCFFLLAKKRIPLCRDQWRREGLWRPGSMIIFGAPYRLLIRQTPYWCRKICKTWQESVRLPYTIFVAGESRFQIHVGSAVDGEI